jgi:competence protein ComEC
MKRNIALTALVTAALFFTAHLQAGELQKGPKKEPKPATVTVYITDTGKKYHTADCASLRKSKHPISLEDAKKSYEPCKRCNPPE